MEFGVYVAEHLLEIIFGLLAAGALAFCKYLHSQNKKLKAFQEADKNREYRKMIMSEIEEKLAQSAASFLGRHMEQ